MIESVRDSGDSTGGMKVNSSEAHRASVQKFGDSVRKFIGNDESSGSNDADASDGDAGTGDPTA